MAEIRMKWAGVEYAIPDNKAFQVGERVEEIATLGEILGWLQQPRFFKMARCLGEMLRFAGCKVSDREIHAQLVRPIGAAEEGEDFAVAVFALVDLLMGDAPRNGSGASKAEGKPDASSETHSR